MHVQESPIASEAPLAPASPAAVRPPRFWPMFVLLAMYWGWYIGSHWLELATFTRFITRLASGALLLLVFLVWWWANRRIPLLERAAGFGVAVLGAAIAAPLCHPAVGGIGLIMGPAALVLTVWVVWMSLAKGASPVARRVGLTIILLVTWGLLLLVRMDSLSGDLRPDIRWRWAPTAEEAFLAEAARADAGGAPAPAVSQEEVRTIRPGDWPHFRGPGRDAIVRGARIRDDWKTAPPRLVWRHRVGPAWSSMVVVGDRLYVRNAEEMACYDVSPP